MNRRGSWEQFPRFIRWNQVPSDPPSVPPFLPPAPPQPAARSGVVRPGPSKRPLARASRDLSAVVAATLAALFQCLRSRGP